MQFLIAVFHSLFSLKPLITKNGSKQVHNRNLDFLIVKLMHVPLPWQCQ